MTTLRQLRYLNALARYRHFGRAAEACSVSQPALSMQIRDLEKDLGAVPVEARDNRVKLLRFAKPEPFRTVGLAWRKTSSRVRDFKALGEIVTEVVA